MAESNESQPRTIGGWASMATVAGAMLGIGIFLVPPIVAERLPTTAGFFSVWIFAAIAALAGAVAYAELGSMMPRAGGDYIFQKEAFGESVAFASGWVLFAGIFTGSVAAVAVPLCEHQIATLVGAMTRALWGPEWGVDMGKGVPGTAGLVSVRQLLAIGIVAAFTTVNTFHAKVSGAVQTALTVVPIALLTVGALYLVASGGEVTPLAGGPTGSQEYGSYVMAWTDAYAAVYFAFSGWNAVIYVAGEVDEPGRNIPLGLVGGTLLVTAVYLVLCWAFTSTLGFGGLAGAYEAGTATAEASLGAGAGLAVNGLIALAMFASLNATVLGGARVAYAMAKAGAFPEYFGRLNGMGVPGRALWLQAGLATLLILTGTFEQILDLVSLAMMFLGAITVGAVYRLRRLDPEADRPYEAAGYPWFPAIYLLSSVLVVVMRVYEVAISGDTSSLYPLWGLLLFGLAWLGHRLWRRGR